MSIPDSLILRYFELATDATLEEIEGYTLALKSGENPRDLKIKLASAIVSTYHGRQEAINAEQEFIIVFSNREAPTDIEEKQLAKPNINIVELLSQIGAVESKNEARRLITQGGVKLDQQKITDQNTIVNLETEKILQVGKRKYYKVKSSK